MAAQSSQTGLSTFRLPSGRIIAYELTYPTEPSRPTILLASSLCAPLFFWDEVVAVLHADGFRVLRFDNPGHGGSGVPATAEACAATTFDDMAVDVYTLLTTAPDVTAAFTGHHSPGAAFVPLLHAWIGVSMGGGLGVVFAARYPGVVRSLVICGSIACSPDLAGVPDTFGPRAAAARAAGGMDADVGAAMVRWFGDAWLKAHPEQAARLRELMLTTTVEGLETCVAALRSPTFDVRPLLPKLAGAVEHVQLVVGEKDANLPAVMAEMRDAVQKGFDAAGKADEKVELCLIPAAGHISFIDGKDAWLAAVMPFLKK